MGLANKAIGEEVEHSATSIPQGISLALIIDDILAFG